MLAAGDGGYLSQKTEAALPTRIGMPATCHLVKTSEQDMFAPAGLSGGGRTCADKEAETMIAAAKKAAVEKAGRSSSEPAISVLHNVRAAALLLGRKRDPVRL